MRAWWPTLLVACGGVLEPDGDLGEFGAVHRAYLVPCTVTTEAGEVPTAFGYVVSRRRACVDGPGQLLPNLDHVGCEHFTHETEALQGCFSTAASPESDVLTFHLAGVGDDVDLTGATSSFIELAPCHAGEPDTVLPRTYPAELRVLSDDGQLAEVDLVSVPASGRLLAEVCR